MPPMNTLGVSNMENRRVLIVGDGKEWFTRGVVSTVYNLDLDEMVYHCDEPIGGPFKSIAHAVESANKALKPKRKKPKKRSRK